MQRRARCHRWHDRRRLSLTKQGYNSTGPSPAWCRGGDKHRPLQRIRRPSITRRFEKSYTVNSQMLFEFRRNLATKIVAGISSHGAADA